MASDSLIENNISSFSLEELNRFIEQRKTAISAIYEVTEIAMDKLRICSLECSSAKDAKDVAEALSAFKALLTNNG